MSRYEFALGVSVVYLVLLLWVENLYDQVAVSLYSSTTVCETGSGNNSAGISDKGTDNYGKEEVQDL